MKNSFACYVLLVLCLGAAFAQIFGTQTQYSDLNQRRQLTPTQQGHILSDIQQHQHRFNLHQNVLNNQQQTFPPQQFGQRILSDNYNQFVGQPNQASFSQNRQLLNPINAQPQILSTQQTLVSTNQPIQTQLPTQSFLPSVLSSVDPLGLNQQPNRLVQHHTQTAFTPNYKQQLQPTANPISQISAHQHLFQVTSNPLFNVDQSQPLDPEKQKERFKELQEKQAIIAKHNEFVEKQYEKALKKAQSDHLDFIKDQQEQKKKLYLKIYKDPGNIPRYRLNNPRYIYPEETDLFNAAVQRYYQEHPTTTTTTTTTPGPSTTTAESNDEPDSKSSRNSGEIFLSSQTKLYSGNHKSEFVSTAPSANLKPKSIQSLDDLEELKNRYESQQINKDDLIAQLKLAIAEDPGEERNLTSREISLPDGRQVEIVRTADPKLPPGTKSPVEKFTLPNGQEVQVIRTADPNFSTGGDLDELVRQKLNLPGGQNFEIVRPNDPKPRRPKSDDKYEIIKTTDPKLATKIEPDSDLDRLVQAKLNLPDGDKYEIIGTGDDPKSIPKGLDLQTAASSSTTVKPPTEIFQELTEGVVPPGANFQILRHDNGGLEQINGLPSTLPDQKKVTFVLLEEQNDGSFKVQGVKGNGAKEKDNVDVDSILQRIKEGDIKLPPPSNKNQIEISKDDFQLEKDVEFSTETSPSSTTTTTKKPDFVPSVLVTPNSFPSDVPSDAPSSFASNAPISTIIGNQFVTESTYPTRHSAKSTESFSYPFETSTSLLNLSPTSDLQKQASTISHSSQNSIFTTAASRGISGFPTSPTFPSTATFPSSTVTIFKSESSPSTATPPTAENGLNELPDLLKKNGLFAMAKFLRQSGLDTILNETGPYTIFAPNDKAFRTLLVQLGGPDKAEEKFRDNPRLLSGLLLHHVIPGAFKIGSLQDEMTGVSLAGTQLRVNQYNMHDAEWNDVKITTINGAKVLEDKRDIEIPQGVAHAVDRVMFPLPVGDIMQTLQSDRERRFTSFLRALFSSDLAETLQGTKTFTLFAPTDRAFAALSGDDLTKTLTDKTLAKELVMRHITPGTLYTNGMRYYQIKDSLDPTKIITISKTGGKIKVNDNPIATQNIPTTNGVIHAVDVLL